MEADERYDFGRKLGAGGFGVVHEALDRVIARRVAIKVVDLSQRDGTEAEAAYARMRQEVRAAGCLSHPNIVTVYDFIETGKKAWIVMELVEGGSLKSLLDRGARIPVSDVVRMMRDILSALAFSHNRGVVHRDVKPANLLLAPDGRVIVADFGIARIESSDLTKVGEVLGAPAYMAPEQLDGEQVDHRADIWSTGVVLYELLTGVKPFPGNPESVVHKVRHTEPKAPSRRSGPTLRAFDAVVARALAKRPEHRFQSAAAFADAVRAAAPQEPPPAPSPRRPLAVALTSGGAVVFAAGVATAFFLLPPSAQTHSAEAERALAENRAALETIERRRIEAGQAAAGAERWMQALREQAAAAEREVADRNAAREEASARLTELTAAAGAVEERLAHLQRGLTEAERQVTDHRAALQRAQAELARALTGREAAQGALRALEARLVELGRNERAAEQRIAALIQQANVEEQRRQGLQRQNTEAEQALADRRATLDRVRQEEQTLRSQLQANEQRRRELERLLALKERQWEQRASSQQPTPPPDQSTGEAAPIAPVPDKPVGPGPVPPSVEGERQPRRRRPTPLPPEAPLLPTPQQTPGPRGGWGIIR
jgi:serine/threonine-protein kinase